MRAVDLGCGSGELTAELHRRLGAADTLGIDSSSAMLGRSAAFAGEGLRFALADIGDFHAEGEYDLVFSNAALHWLSDHPTLLERLRRALRPGGQLAVQVPANHEHASHRVAVEVAGEEPFHAALGGTGRQTSVLAPAAYAELLARLGAAAQHVRLQIYGHRLSGPEEVVEWVKGTTLTEYQRRLAPPLFAEYLERYRTRLLARLGDARPYFFAFPRILFWARF